MQVMQLCADQARNLPVVVVGFFLIEGQDFYNRRISKCHCGESFYGLKNTQSLSGRKVSPSRSRNVSAFFSRSVPTSFPCRKCLVTVAGIDACSKILWFVG